MISSTSVSNSDSDFFLKVSAYGSLAKSLCDPIATDWPAALTDPRAAATRVAFLKNVLLREPDAAMAEAGDVSTWKAMVEAALAEAG